METIITMRTRDGKAYAEGIYTGENTIVKAGGKISSVFRGKNTALRYRQDNEYVDTDGNILKDCTFSSPSTAAQFVNGNISNGMRVWKVNGETLGSFLNRTKKK